MTIKITRQTLDNVIEAIGGIDAEAGGILGIKNNVICSFYFDGKAPRYYQEYHPNIEDLNLKIAEWGKKRLPSPVSYIVIQTVATNSPMQTVNVFILLQRLYLN